MKVQVTNPGFAERQIVRKYVCIRNCGWYRPYTDNARWLKKRIVHPMWGTVTQEVAVANDVYHHNCHEYTQARNRARKLFGEPRTYGVSNG